MNSLVLLHHRRHWTDDLRVNSRGVVGNLRNALYALRHAPEWDGVLAYDDFAAKVVTKKPPPWGDRNIDRWSDDDDTSAMVWFQEQNIPVAVGVVGRAIRK
jgi:hypothetical protein